MIETFLWNSGNAAGGRAGLPAGAKARASPLGCDVRPIVAKQHTRGRQVLLDGFLEQGQDGKTWRARQRGDLGRFRAGGLVVD
jgi:hypothetical protein